jgi:hypothetical protein
MGHLVPAGDGRSALEAGEADQGVDGRGKREEEDVGGDVAADEPLCDAGLDGRLEEGAGAPGQGLEAGAGGRGQCEECLPRAEEPGDSRLAPEEGDARLGQGPQALEGGEGRVGERGLDLALRHSHRLLKDRLARGEVAEQSARGDAHRLGQRRRRERAEPLEAEDPECGPGDLGPALCCRPSHRGVHS